MPAGSVSAVVVDFAGHWHVTLEENTGDAKRVLEDTLIIDEDFDVYTDELADQQDTCHGIPKEIKCQGHAVSAGPNIYGFHHEGKPATIQAQSDTLLTLLTPAFFGEAPVHLHKISES